MGQIIQKDIRARRQIRNRSTFERVMTYIINSFGAPTNLTGITDHLRNTQGLTIKRETEFEPEFLWKSLPECAALRVPGKRPWFAVVGRVGRDKFGLEGEGVVEVINLKDEPSAVRERIAGGIAYPAYHMNKQHWYTLFLDGRMPDDEVVALIEKSYAIVNA